MPIRGRSEQQAWQEKPPLEAQPPFSASLALMAPAQLGVPSETAGSSLGNCLPVVLCLSVLGAPRSTSLCQAVAGSPQSPLQTRL